MDKTKLRQYWQERKHRIYRHWEYKRLKRIRRKTVPAYTYCKNCGTELKGMYCHRCGQYALDIEQPFWKYFKQYFENMYQFDSKIWVTLRLMFTRPGFLTREFNAGKINSYVHPFRLYMCISVVFFTIFFMMATDTLNRKLFLDYAPDMSSQLVDTLNSGRLRPDTTVLAYHGEDLKTLLSMYEIQNVDSLVQCTSLWGGAGTTYGSLYRLTLPTLLLDSLMQQMPVADSDVEALRWAFNQPNDELEDVRDDIRDERRDLNLEARKGTKLTAADSMKLKALLQTEQGLLQGRKKALAWLQADSVRGEKLMVYGWKQIRQDEQQEVAKLRMSDFSNSLMGRFAKWTPFYMMFLLPLFAAMLRMFFRRENMVYMKHFAHAVHLNTVLLFLIAVPMLIGAEYYAMEGAFVNHTLGRVMAWWFVADAVIMPIYTIVSMRVVYGEGWLKTIVKGLLFVGLFSFISLAIALALTVWAVYAEGYA